MSKGPDLVFSWEINDISKIEDGMVKSSRVYYAKGLPWRIVAKKIDSELRIILECNLESELLHWSCDTQVDYKAIAKDGDHFNAKKTKRFHSDVRSSHLFYFSSPELLPNANFVNEDKVTIEFGIAINKLTGIRDTPITDFSSPNQMSNLILIIEEKKLYLSRDFLAVHSPVFEVMLFGDFAEKGKEEVEIKDVLYQEFVDLLHVIYPEQKEINASSVVHILSLADRFQMKNALQLAESYLITSNKFEDSAKLELADRYKLKILRDVILESFISPKSLAPLKNTHEFNSFSDAMKASILDRLMELVLKE